jgi:AraC-like DNA-binding protein
MVEIFEDIRKIYEFRQPCSELSPYIEFFSESSADKTARLINQDSFSVKMFQSWTPTIWLNLGSLYELETESKRITIGTNQDVLVLRQSVVTRYASSTDQIFTIKFHPGGLEAILGIKPQTLFGNIMNISKIIPVRIIRDIKESDGLAARAALVEHYFLTRLKISASFSHDYSTVQQVLAGYQANEMDTNLYILAEKIPASLKTINRHFNRVIGVGPCRYFSVLRARKALTAYINDKKTFDPKTFGYYDHSHFYRAATNFTGLPFGTIPS